jgi:hypothetical protein
MLKKNKKKKMILTENQERQQKTNVDNLFKKIKENIKITITL